MNEIKFRVWDKEVKDMSKGMTLTYWLNHFKELGDSSNKSLVWMQFIGLKDKKGKEIYEGDILKDSPRNWKILWNDESAQFRKEIIGEIEGIQMQIFDGRPLEVIGNIYKNPELFNDEGGKK